VAKKSEAERNLDFLPRDWLSNAAIPGASASKKQFLVMRKPTVPLRPIACDALLNLLMLIRI
jgi:hypothetical protein